jgi:predicted histidine transporter YuiF (NhaC family)
MTMEVNNIVIISIIIGLLLIIFYLYSEKEGYKNKLTNYNDLSNKLSGYDKLTTKIIDKIDLETILPPPEQIIKDVYKKFIG